MSAMELAEFAEFHRPALERDEARHNLMLGILGRPQDKEHADLRLWTLGRPGECAIQTQGFPIVLGELGAAQCRAFAEATRGIDYPGVVGNDDTALWFVEGAAGHGLDFAASIGRLIHALRDRPVYPGARGAARPVGAADVTLFAQWMLAFHEEALPHDPRPSRERLEKTAAEGNFQFWIVDGEPVAMASIVRRTRHSAAIGGVYTPPALRGRGYAGSVTAAVVERAFAEGRTTACLYTDLSNPASNRCYAKIGFVPLCPSWHYIRR